MIDFKNAVFSNLESEPNSDLESIISPTLIEGETIIKCYKSGKDSIVFTNKRVIVVNTQGFFWLNRDFTSLPYSKIQVFSFFDGRTSENGRNLELWFYGIGNVKFNFKYDENMYDIYRIISNCVL